MLDGQVEPPPDRNPSCVAAEESGRRLARAVLESMDAIKLDAVVYPSWNNPLTDRRPQFATTNRPISDKACGAPFCTSSISYSEVARWLSAFRTYGSRSNS